MTEKEIREQIAQEIESYWNQQVKDGIGVHFEFNSEFCFKEAIAIVRQAEQSTPMVADEAETK
jgi:hypothetical protein